MFTSEAISSGPVRLESPAFSTPSFSHSTRTDGGSDEDGPTTPLTPPVPNLIPLYHGTRLVETCLPPMRESPDRPVSNFRPRGPRTSLHHRTSSKDQPVVPRVPGSRPVHPSPWLVSDVHHTYRRRLPRPTSLRPPETVGGRRGGGEQR